jgi:isoamylase
MATAVRALGASVDAEKEVVEFAVFSANASRIDLCLYDLPSGADERASYTLTRGAGSIWRTAVPLHELEGRGVFSPYYYGYRAWGANWPFDPSWVKGSLAGFSADVDDGGNRFNPNKLLIDPYAREISHDPEPRLVCIDPNEYADDFYSGEGFRERDTGRIAPKGLVPAHPEPAEVGEKPRRHIKDDIIYEVHPRGFTMLDPAVPAAWRGTYRGAAHKAGYLKELGVTAVQFLPVQAFANEQNDDGDPCGDNYWGYMTLAYFAPNRRYSSDKSPGGPTREFKEMVRVFHEHQIKVFLDVVFNHSAEGVLKRMTDSDESRQEDTLQYPERACLLSLRGLDNGSYHVLRSNPVIDGGRHCTRYQDNSGCGGNLNAANPAVRDLVIDSLRYWSDEMGVDGFRFDLAPILGNEQARDGFRFGTGDPGSILNRAVTDLPARSPETLQGVDLIAEPWALGDGTYQLGSFPDGWSEWNDYFRDTLRKAENQVGVEEVTPGELANVFSGSRRQFARKGSSAPWHSINYLTAHDGFTLRDLFSYTTGSHSWDHGGVAAEQRKGVRNALALLMVSAGVPMIMGGDELNRTLGGRTNTSALDDDSVYLQWPSVGAAVGGASGGSEPDAAATLRFTRNVMQFRLAHPALRRQEYYTGVADQPGGSRDIAWFGADGEGMTGESWDDPGVCYLAFRIGGAGKDSVSSIYVGYNKGPAGVSVRLPVNLPGLHWKRVCDTAEWMEPLGNWEEEGTPVAGEYYLHGRSVIILVEGGVAVAPDTV